MVIEKNWEFGNISFIYFLTFYLNSAGKLQYWLAINIMDVQNNFKDAWNK